MYGVRMYCMQIQSVNSLCDVDQQSLVHEPKFVYFSGSFCRYERLLAEYICDVTPGVVYCPRPGCRSRVFSDPDDSLAICDCCRYPFCKNCNKLWHGGEACKTNDEVRFM